MPLHPVTERAPAVAKSLLRRTMGLSVSEFGGQWRNPNDVLSVVLIIGAETVRSALAHLAGNSTFVPVCFSFGWVAFSFNMIVSIAGEGRLMPDPDYPCKIINAESGYGRENRSWMVGRLLRDNEEPLTNEALCVTVWKAVSGTKGRPKAGHSDRWSRIFIMNGLVMIVQLVIAAVPWMTDGDWSIFLTTTIGTVLALMMGALPQWRAEKFSCRTNESKKDVLITRGIGTRQVMMIIGDGHCLDIEDLAGSESPRSYRMWQNFYNLDANKSDANDTSLPAPANSPTLQKGVTLSRIMSHGGTKPRTVDNVPIAFWFTRIICFVFALLWICLLISVAGLKTNAWFLLLVGAIGMIQNSFVAGFRQDMVACGLHLEKQEDETVKGEKVMKVLMALEMERPNAGLCLMEEYFPGELHHDEEAWWDAARLRTGERKYAKALAKSRNGLHNTPIRPDWEQYHRKYGTTRQWNDICGTLYKPTPLDKLPEHAQERLGAISPASSTTAGLDEKSASVHVSGSLRFAP